MVTCSLTTANVSINTCIHETASNAGTEQEMIEAKARVSLPPIPFVVPKRIGRFVRVNASNGIYPSEIK
jgi:predicted RNA polymerase sigma factor